MLVRSLAAQSAHDPVPDLAIGRRIFDSQCAVCHGQGGTGGRGPALTQPRLAKAPDDAALRRAIAEGLPPEMPGSWQLSVREVASVAAYVRSLGAVQPEPVPGEPARGKTLFASRGCAGCHIVSGAGSSRGPELTAIGARRNPAFLRRSLLDPAADRPEGFLVVEAVPLTGAPVRGVRSAEDPFTIQIQDASGRFHSFRKASLKTLRRLEGQSTMPPYKAAQPADLDDLVAYLASLRGDR